ncbi:MAG: hypothetical protein R6V04_06060 [bacterium]
MAQQFFQNRRNRSEYLTAVIVLLIVFIAAGCYKGHGLEPEPPAGKIQGQVEFIGQWPDSTREARVAVLKEYPFGISHADILRLFNFVQDNYVTDSDTIPRGTRYYHYSLELPPGEYAWILVVWFPDIPNYFLGVKELGAYYEDMEQEYPSLVMINAGETVLGLDIRADFANVNNEDPFF